jgi:hypothetical protein
VLPGGVRGVGAAQGLQPAQGVLRAARLDVIKVQGDDIPAGHGAGLAASAGQGAGHKPAHVLQVVLAAFGQGQVLGHGFGAGTGTRSLSTISDQYSVCAGQRAALRLPAADIVICLSYRSILGYSFL